MNVVGIDLALRNSASVILDSDFNFVDCCVFTSDKKKIDEEELLVYNHRAISNFMQAGNATKVFIEGLSFNSASLTKDIIAGNFWYLRTRLKEELALSSTIISPASWRAKVFDAEQKAELKEYRKVNKGYGNMLKEMALRNVPEEVRGHFIKYLTDRKLAGKFIYDLADAYCIAKYGVLINL